MKIGLLEQKTYRIYTFYTWDGLLYQSKKTKLDLEEIQKGKKYTFASDMDLIVTLDVKDVEMIRTEFITQIQQWAKSKNPDTEYKARM